MQTIFTFDIENDGQKPYTVKLLRNAPGVN